MKKTISIISLLVASLSFGNELSIINYKINNVKSANKKIIEKEMKDKIGIEYSNANIEEIENFILNLGIFENVEIMPTITEKGIFLNIYATEKENINLKENKKIEKNVKESDIVYKNNQEKVATKVNENSIVEVVKTETQENAVVERKSQEINDFTDFVIEKINIIGNTIFTEKEIKEFINVKEKTNLSKTVLDNDLDKLAKTGLFAEVNYNVKNNKDKTVDVDFIVKENPIVNKVDISGNTIFDNNTLIKALGIKLGQVVNSNLFNPEKNGIIDLYKKNGYILAVIENIQLDGDTVHLKLSEGVINNISYSSDDDKLKTKNYILDRINYLQKGTVFNEKFMNATLEEIYRTGLFTSIEPIFTIDKEDTNLRNIEIKLAERPTSSINANLSYGTESGITGGLKLADNNFLGTQKDVSINGEFSSKGNKSISLSYFDPWIKGTKMWQGGGSLFFKETTNKNAKLSEPANIKQRGLTYTFGKAFSNKWTLRDTLSAVKYNEILGSKKELEKYTLFSNTINLTYDNRDNKFNPTKGVYADLSYQFGFLKDRKSLLNENENHFQQFEADLRAYHPLFGKKNSMAYRFVFGKTTSGTPNGLRYSIGGSETLRGYDAGAFSGFDKFHVTIENRTKINDTLQLVAFLDLGNATQNKEVVNVDGVELEKYTPNNNLFKNIKMGYGVGARINTAMGILRFDYGFAPTKDSLGNKKLEKKFYFSFGQSF